MNLSKIVTCAVFAVGVAGCTHPTDVGITSSKLNAYQPHIKRLLVLTELGSTLKMGDGETAFDTTLNNAMDTCGIAVNVHRHDPLALQNEEQLALKTFSPDTVMTLVWKSEHTYGNIPTSVVIMGSILDVSSKKVVWKSEINLAPASHAGETLAASIIERLKKENILGADCPMPVVPKP